MTFLKLNLYFEYFIVFKLNPNFECFMEYFLCKNTFKSGFHEDIPIRKCFTKG